MIYSIQGIISHKDKNFLIVEANRLGYQVFVINSLLEKIKIGQTIKLFTYLATKEETVELYGFETESELKYFKLLNSVSGIGPKLGINVLSLVRIPDLERAILEENVPILTRVSGIGMKIAKKIILELKEKVEKTALQTPGPEDDALVIDVLTGMGYPLIQAREAIRKIPPDVLETKKRIKQALNILSGR